tara:strand:- start:3471 stop:4217 length:747 start_codon:yes stop_codon:yes gene_type:complete
MNYKDLYINGCSFTKGHALKPKDTWPTKLSNLLSLRLINHSKNAQGLESIVYNSIAHLSELDPKETLVVIGFTWLDRYLVQAFGYNFTLTGGDLANERTQWGHRLGDRASSPFSIYEHYTEKNENYFSDDIRERLNNILTKYREYLKELMTGDPEYLKHVQLKGVTLKIMLQSFLKDNNFNYRFIDFAADSGLYSRIIKTNPSIKNKLDYSKIIDIDYKKFCGTHQDGHPTAECCTYIADKLNNEFKL